MPGLHPFPPWALLAGVDTRVYHGVSIFDRGGPAVVWLAPPQTAAGLYDDAFDVLNNRGVHPLRALAADLASVWTGVGTATCGIDASDRFFVEASLADFTVSARAGNVFFGFDAAGYGSIGGAPPFRRTATFEWRRGILDGSVPPPAGPYLEIDPVGAAAAFNLPSFNYRAQDLITLIRSQAGIDVDAPHYLPGTGKSVDQIDNEVYRPAFGDLRWGITDDGHVFSAWPGGAVPGITWLSTAFRDRLGFRGDETAVAVGTLDVQTAAYRLPGALFPSRRFQRYDVALNRDASMVRLRDGETRGVTRSEWVRRRLQAWVGGWANPDDDQHQHLVRRVAPFLRPGATATVYQQWGDPRRAVDLRAPDDAYSLLYTPEQNGRRGRIRGRIADLLEVPWQQEGERGARGRLELDHDERTTG